MAQRLDFSTALHALFESGVNIYFRPPEDIKMSYPAIRYDVSNVSILKANNRPYKFDVAYEVIVIDRDPDSVIYKTLLNNFDYVSVNSFYTSNGLNHTVLTIYY